MDHSGCLLQSGWWRDEPEAEAASQSIWTRTYIFGWDSDDHYTARRDPVIGAWGALRAIRKLMARYGRRYVDALFTLCFRRGKPPVLEAATPHVPSLQPYVPSLQPCVPGLQPCVPGLQPYVPSLQPCVPGLQPCVPSLQPCVPGLQPCVPQAGALRH